MTPVTAGAVRPRRARQRADPLTHFTMAERSSAGGPPEARSLARDEVRLMVNRGSSLAVQTSTHTRFRELADHLDPGDLIVVNTSATVAAAVSGHRCDKGGAAVVVHFSSPIRGGQWIVELRDGALQRVMDAAAGERIDLPHGVTLMLAEAWPDRTQLRGSRLWVAELAVESGVASYLTREGRPIAYDHIHGQWPLADYQTIFAQHPGSVEMVSAARPFSLRLVADLHTRGIALTPLTLHTGLSSLEAGERPLPERYDVPAATARRVNATRARGGRIVAVGTTVTRALETVTAPDGEVQAGQGVTNLVIGPDRPPRVVNGLITGWHEPQASHLLLLEAIAGPDLVATAYRAAIDPANGGYLWHEFGDSCLFLPSTRPVTRASSRRRQPSASGR